MLSKSVKNLAKIKNKNAKSKRTPAPEEIDRTSSTPSSTRNEIFRSGILGFRFALGWAKPDDFWNDGTPGGAKVAILFKDSKKIVKYTQK